MFYTYVLFSEKDRGFYKGYTRNLDRRLEQHNAGKVKSTNHRRPLKVIYYEACLDSRDARRREKYFKTHYGRMFLAKRLKEYLKAQRN
jgi:putative endonuclease